MVHSRLAGVINYEAIYKCKDQYWCLRVPPVLIKFLRTCEESRLVIPSELVDKLSLQKLWTLGFDFYIVMKHCDTRIELHAIEVREQVDGATLLSETRSHYSLASYCAVKRSCHTWYNLFLAKDNIEVKK
jgi:hypothetical protein